MSDPETRESSPSHRSLELAKQQLLEQIEERLRRSGEDVRQLLQSFAEAIPEPEPPAPPPPSPSVEESDREGVLAIGDLRDALAAIDGAGTQSEVLSRLLEQATRYASRVALFLAGGDADGSALLGWSGSGFEQTGPSVEGLVLPLPGGSPWPAVLDGRGSLQLTAADCAPLCSRIETALPKRGALIPLVLRDKVEAVLYGDQEADDPFSVEALQVLTHLAAQTLEIVPLRHQHGSATLRIGDAAAAPPPPAEAAPPPAAEAIRQPVPEPVAEPAAELPVQTAPEAEEESEHPTLSTTPLVAMTDLEPAVEEPQVAAVPAEEEALEWAAEPPQPPSAPPSQPVSAPPSFTTEPAPPAVSLTRGEQEAGFVLEPLDDEAFAPSPSPPPDLEPAVDLSEEEGVELEPPAPPTAAPPTEPARPAAPQPPGGALLEPVESPPPAAPPVRPPEPPPPPASPPGPPLDLPPDFSRDTQLISALSPPPAAAPPAPPSPTPPSPAPPSPAAPPAAPTPAAPAPPVEMESAPTVSSGEVVPPADIEGPGWAFSDKPTTTPSGSEPLHDEARRLARLLVSEIKLYNEELIAEGKRKGNIYQELREDIDRSRQMYEERIDEQVRASSDYFREELIRSLAGGDAAVMGL